MGNLQDSNKRYIIIYGQPSAGKTRFFYQLLSNNEESELKLLTTFGVNYGEIKLDKIVLALFDINGYITNYNVCNMLCKSVLISGIIFIINMQEINKIDQTKDTLELILGNNYLPPNQILYIIYNKPSEVKEDDHSWIDEELLENKLELKKLKEKYKIKAYFTQILDVSSIRSDLLPKGLYELESLLL